MHLVAVVVSRVNCPKMFVILFREEELVVLGVVETSIVMIPASWQHSTVGDS